MALHIETDSKMSNIIPQAEFDRFNKACQKAYRTKVEDSTSEFYPDLCSRFYQIFVEQYGFDAIEQSIEKFDSVKFAARIRHISEMCKSFIEEKKEEMFNNIADVLDKATALELRDYMPLGEKAIWEYLQGSGKAISVEKLSAIIAQHLEWYYAYEEENFWPKFHLNLLQFYGETKGDRLYRDVLKRINVWEKYFGREMAVAYESVKLPSKEELTADESILLKFLRDKKSKYDFFSLRKFAKGSSDVIFNEVKWNNLSEYLISVLLAYGSSRLKPNEVNELLLYPKRLHKKLNDRSREIRIINAANDICISLGYAPIPYYSRVESAPINGEYVVPWQNVIFGDGFIEITKIKFAGSDEVTTCKHNDAASDRAFNWLQYYFTMKVAPIVLQTKDGKVIGGSFPNLGDHVRSIVTLTKLETIKISRIEVQEPESNERKGTLKKISYEDFRTVVPVNKNLFMDKLCQLMVDKENVWKYEELSKHTQTSSLEHGFAFMIAENENDILYAFENFNDFRCTLLFTVSKENGDEELVDVSDYLSSQVENKRQKMQWGRKIMVNEKPIRYDRVEHDDNWDSNIRYHINRL